MNLIKQTIQAAIGHLESWLSDVRGAVAMEAAFIFPVLGIMLIGLVDTGNAILINQKVISASQSVAGIITRNDSVSPGALQKMISAGQLIMMPQSITTPADVDIRSFSFDGAAIPNITQEWSYKNSGWTISGSELTKMNNSITSVATPNSGVVVVGVHYVYTPMFIGSFIGTLDFVELSYAGGRITPVVSCNGC